MLPVFITRDVKVLCAELSGSWVMGQQIWVGHVGHMTR